MSWSPVIKQLIKAAESKGIKFRWASPQEMDTKMGKGVMGFYNPKHKCVVVRKGMSLKDTEETITHEISHALWDLSLKSSKVKRGNLKKMKINTSLPTWLTLLFGYKKSKWQEERFCYHMQTKPALVLHLFNQL